MDVSLVLVQQDRKQREIPLRKATVVIGRDSACQIRIPTDAVSRRHCELSQESGQLTIKDLGSSNGTFVNKRRITQSELVAGDIISVGPVVFVVRADGHPKTVDSNTALSMGAPVAPPAVGAPAPATVAKPAHSKGKPRSLLDDDQDDAPAPASEQDDMEDSSLSDFDFLDDEEDDGQPKL